MLQAESSSNTERLWSVASDKHQDVCLEFTYLTFSVYETEIQTANVEFFFIEINNGHSLLPILNNHLQFIVKSINLKASILLLYMLITCPKNCKSFYFDHLFSKPTYNGHPCKLLKRLFISLIKLWRSLHNHKNGVKSQTPLAESNYIFKH